jgi:DNA-binding protein H-NS
MSRPEKTEISNDGLRYKSKKGTLAGKKVAPKYRNPANPEQTWTGRGVSPTWVQELKTAGTLESALIAPVASL